jgi:hypothetical protein
VNLEIFQGIIRDVPSASEDLSLDLLDRLKSHSDDFKSWGPNDVFLDLAPKPPSFDEATDFQVRVAGGGQDDEYVLLNDVFPILQWGDAYQQNNLRGHVFCRSCAPEVRRHVASVAYEVLTEAGLDLNPKAISEAKIR